MSNNAQIILLIYDGLFTRLLTRRLQAYSVHVYIYIYYHTTKAHLWNSGDVFRNGPFADQQFRTAWQIVKGKSLVFEFIDKCVRKSKKFFLLELLFTTETDNLLLQAKDFSDANSVASRVIIYVVCVDCDSYSRFIRKYMHMTLNTGLFCSTSIYMSWV